MEASKCTFVVLTNHHLLDEVQFYAVLIYELAVLRLIPPLVAWVWA